MPGFAFIHRLKPAADKDAGWKPAKGNGTNLNELERIAEDVIGARRERRCELRPLAVFLAGLQPASLFATSFELVVIGMQSKPVCQPGFSRLALRSRSFRTWRQPVGNHLLPRLRRLRPGLLNSASFDNAVKKCFIRKSRSLRIRTLKNASFFPEGDTAQSTRRASRTLWGGSPPIRTIP